MADRGVWNYGDLQSRYDRAQSLANDCTQDFAGNYFFPSDRSPKGFWTTTRRQVLDYVCDCPDFAFKIDQQITNYAPSRWVRGDWSVYPDNRILVNRCIHCFAVAIVEQEVDPRFPVNRQYQAKRSRFPKTDCGCGCGGSGDCGCPSKILGLPEPKLLLGCDTDCYVQPLTPRTQRTPSTTEGVPAYQTFAISEIQFTETKFKSCGDRQITITLERNTSQGWNNATVSGLNQAIEFQFEPEFKTSSLAVDLTGNFAGVYVLTISAIASGNFGEKTEAELTIVDCSLFNLDFPDLEEFQCFPDEFIDFGGGKCEGSYLVANYTTGNKNPDGTCEIIKVRKFEEGLDCPDPEDPPPKECESLIPRDCPVIRPSPPKCVQGSGFNAIVKVQNGKKDTEYLRPDKKECAEYCQFENLAVNSPACPEPPPKPVPPPFCPIPASRYFGWANYDFEAGGRYRKVGTNELNLSVIGTEIVETFVCGELEPSTSIAAIIRNSKKTFVLIAYIARCMAPVNRYLDSVQEAFYAGNAFGEGCCRFDETKPPRPVCPEKWKCVDGVCVKDASGTFKTQAECIASGCESPRSYRLTYQGPALSAEDIKFTGTGEIGITYNPSQSITYTLGALIYTRPQDGMSYYYCELRINGAFVANISVTTPYPATGFSSPCVTVSLQLL